MGSSVSLSSPLIRHFQVEYDRVKSRHGNSSNSSQSHGRSNSAAVSSSFPQYSSPFLYSELISLQPFPSLPIDFSHLAVIYCIDSTRSGKPTFNELIDFLSFCESKQRDFERHEFRSRLEGLCLIKLIFDCGVHGGEFLADWLCRLVIANKPCISVDSAPGLVYVHRDSISPLFLTLKPYFPIEVEFPEFFDQLQLSAENVGLLELEEESLDNYIPIAVLRAFSINLIRGILSIAKSIGLPTANFNLATEFGASIEQLNASAVKKRRMSKKWPNPLASTRSVAGSGFYSSMSPASLRPPVGKHQIPILAPMGRAKSVSGLGENSLINSPARKNSTFEKSNLKSLKAGRSFHASTLEETANAGESTGRSGKLDNSYSPKVSPVNENSSGNHGIFSNSHSNSSIPGSISPVKSARRSGFGFSQPQPPQFIDEHLTLSTRLQSPLNSPSARRRSPHHGKTQLELPGSKEESTNFESKQRSGGLIAGILHPSGIPKIPKNKIVPINTK